MSYVDTTLTPATGYTYVNNKQFYDALVVQLSAHSAWSFVEQVDFVNGTTTFSSYVWKCSAAQSGLPNDFYVIFRMQYLNTASAGLGYSISVATLVILGEAYNSSTHTLTKYAPAATGSAQPIAADGTNGGSWTLSAALPTTAPNIPFQFPFGPGQQQGTGSTSARLLSVVTRDGIKVTYTYATNGNNQQLYVGAIDTFLSSTDDPMPIVIGGYANANNGGNQDNSNQQFSSTRHPKFGGTSTGNGDTFRFGPNVGNNSSNNAGLVSGALFSWIGTNTWGVVGDPTNFNYSMFLGGAVTTKGCISTTTGQSTGATGNNGARLGGLRGTFKDVVGAQTVAHSFGDTFVIGGVAYAGPGTATTSYSGNGLLDTSAT